MQVRDDIRNSTIRLLNSRRLLLAQVFGNIILFLWFSAWLQISEERTWYLILSVVCALAFIGAGAALHGGTLAHFAQPLRGSHARGISAKMGLWHALPLLLWALLLLLLWKWIGLIDEVREGWTLYLRSEMPAALRNLVSAKAIQNFFNSLFFVLRWIAIPALMLPLAQQIALRGFRCFSAESRRSMKAILGAAGYWLTILLASVVGVYLPSEFMGWTVRRETATLSFETASLIARLLISYLLALASYLMLCSVMGLRAQPDGAASNAAG
jgi:hypothetical protein